MQCPRCGLDANGDVCAACGAPLTEETPRWYAEGIAHLTGEQQYEIARELLKEGLERYPASAMLWFNGGVLEERVGNARGALKHYQEAFKLKPTSEKYRLTVERLLGRPVPRQVATPPPMAPAPAPVVPPLTVVIETPAPVAPPSPVVVETPVSLLSSFSPVEETPVPVVPPSMVETVVLPPADEIAAPIFLDPDEVADDIPALPMVAVVEDEEAAIDEDNIVPSVSELPPLPSADAIAVPPPTPEECVDVEEVGVGEKTAPATQLAHLSTFSLDTLWRPLSIASGILALVALVLLLVALFGKNSGMFVLTLVLFAVMVVLRFVSNALATEAGERYFRHHPPR